MASNLLARPLPREYELGRCAHLGVDPRDYDSDCHVVGASPTANGRPSLTDRSIDAVAKCDGCPIVQLCAEMALKEKPYGVIRAGISLGSTALRKWQRQALQLIADGYEARSVIESLNPALRITDPPTPASAPKGPREIGGGV